MTIKVYQEPTSNWTLGRTDSETKLRCMHEYAYLDTLDDEILYCDDCDNDFQTINGVDEQNDIAINLLISRAEQLAEY